MVSITLIRACNRFARTSVMNQSAQRLRITVDSCKKSSMMTATSHVEMRTRKIVILPSLGRGRSGID